MKHVAAYLMDPVLLSLFAELSAAFRAAAFRLKLDEFSLAMNESSAGS